MSAHSKNSLDEKIQKNAIDFLSKSGAESLLCYNSMDMEISTKQILAYALNQNIALFLPKCSSENVEMNFFEVSELNDLKKGIFSVFEPNSSSKVYSNQENSICIIPCLAADSYGFRLGWGKGYYDRFLKDYDGVKAVLCYSFQVKENIPTDEYDIAADFIITEKGVFKAKIKSAE